MATARCSELAVKGMFHRQDEMWISTQPFLLMTYVTQVCPALGRWLGRVAGPARIKALQTGGNIFDAKVSWNL